MKTNKVNYPEYWAKRKKKLNPALVKQLEETAEAEPVVSDEYGEYKPGIFLHKAAIVTVTRENDLWGLHIYSEHNIGLPLIEEVRYKYLPDDALMVQMFGKRCDYNALEGIMLYEVPQNVPENNEEK